MFIFKFIEGLQHPPPFVRSVTNNGLIRRELNTVLDIYFSWQKGMEMKRQKKQNKTKQKHSYTMVPITQDMFEGLLFKVVCSHCILIPQGSTKKWYFLVPNESPYFLIITPKFRLQIHYILGNIAKNLLISGIPILIF